MKIRYEHWHSTIFWFADLIHSPNCPTNVLYSKRKFWITCCIQLTCLQSFLIWKSSSVLLCLSWYFWWILASYFVECPSIWVCLMLWNFLLALCTASWSTNAQLGCDWLQETAFPAQQSRAHANSPLPYLGGFPPYPPQIWFLPLQGLLENQILCSLEVGPIILLLIYLMLDMAAGFFNSIRVKW